MKKTRSLFLICGMALGLAACVSQSAESVKPQEPQQQESGTQLPEAMTSMAAPIHALAETMLETEADYQPQNPEFFWNSLHFFLETYGNRHESVSLLDGGVKRVPRKTMQEHAIALFSEYDDLPELPESLSGRISYDESWDAYLVSPEECAPYTLALADMSEKGGVYYLEASLSNAEGETVGTWEVEMVKNTYADGIESPLYPYSISSMRAIGTQKEQAIFNSLSDSHTAEVILNDGTVVSFQFDADSDISHALSSLQAGESFTIEYATDEAGGAMQLIGVYPPQ